MRRAATAWLVGSALLLAFATTMVLATVATGSAPLRGCAGAQARHLQCAHAAIVQHVPLKIASWQQWPGEIRQAGLVVQGEVRQAGPAVKSRPLAGTRLNLGMTDTQVLSLPGWGRPDAVARSRDGAVYRELWIYNDRMTGARRSLVLENARVVATSEPNLAVAPVAPMDPQAVLIVRPDGVATVANR